jgi:hypothetical protein
VPWHELAAAAARRRRLILLALAGSAVLWFGSVLGLLVLIVSAALLPARLGYKLFQVVERGVCAVVGCGSARTVTPSSATYAVQVRWLSVERKAVAYYCARAADRGDPCVDVAFVQAIMMAESGGNPLAVSSAGALGLMQVEPSHFQPGQDPLDPLTKVMVGVRFLNSLDVLFDGNLPLVAAGYNAGPGAVQYWESVFHTSNWAFLSAQPLVETWGNGQTWNYVQEVMAYYQAFSKKARSGSGSGQVPIVVKVHG